MRFLTPNFEERRSSKTNYVPSKPMYSKWSLPLRIPTKILQILIIKRMYVKCLA